MLIVTVLKQSKKFTPKHAKWIHRQFAPLESVCLTDAKKIGGVRTAPLLYEFPNWWSKLELFNPNHPVLGQEDLLYFDLDMVITGDIRELMAVANDFTMLSGLSYTNQCNSSIMYIPCAIKEPVWQQFMSDPERHMAECNTPECWGDQGFLSKFTQPKQWQTLLPNRIFSYKVDIATPEMIGYEALRSNGKHLAVPPDDAIVVCFHGYPSPWKTGFAWVPFFSIKESISGKIKAIKAKRKAVKSSV